MKIYSDTKSGNCYKVQLVCTLLNIDHQWIVVDILAGDRKSDEDSCGWGGCPDF